MIWTEVIEGRRAVEKRTSHDSVLNTDMLFSHIFQKYLLYGMILLSEHGVHQKYSIRILNPLKHLMTCTAFDRHL